MKQIPKLLLFLQLFLGYICLNGQVEFTIEAPAEVSVGQPFEVSFVLKNAEANSQKFPNFEGFKVLTGPSYSSSTTIINGQRTSSMSYSFTLMAEEKGNKVIGIATVTVDRKTFYSPGKKINVVDVKSIPQGQSSNDGWAIQAKARASKNTLYVGEQMVMHYEFYYGEQLGITDRPTLPQFKDFFIKRLEVGQQELPSIRVGDRMYNGVLFDAVSLFPQTTGDKVIPPATYHLERQEGQNDPFNPFKSSAQKSVPTNATKITVKPLPVYDKKDFSGGVGNYTLDGSLSKNSISADQSTTIRLRIKGNGDVMQLTPPTLALDPSIEVFPPKQISSNEAFEGNQLVHVTEYEYALKPKKEGSYPINVDLVYFDPSSAKYTSASKSLGTLAVAKGAKKSFTQFYDGAPTSDSNPWRYAILLGSLFLAGIIYFYGRPQKKSLEKQTSTNNDRMSKMEKLDQRASAKLARAKAFMDNNESVAFFKEVETSINQVVQEKFQLTNEEMTKQRLREIIDTTYNNTELGEDYMGIFTKVDMARYAGSSTQNMSEIYTKASQFIKDFEGMV